MQYDACTSVILIVEDREDDIVLIDKFFQSAGIPNPLQFVRTGEEAVAYLSGEGKYSNRAEYPLPAIILLDLKMPGLSGFEFLQWLHSESPGDQRLIPVVVMSSSGLPEDVKRAYALGVNSYMTKPVDWNSFKERIKALGIYWSEHAETPAISS